MNVATIEAGASRTAIMAWRDEATLAAMVLVYDAAATAMRGLETRFDAITNVEAMTNAEGTARAIVRPAMREAVGPAADRWFTVQARALRQTDGRLGPLALRFAAVSTRPTLPHDVATSADSHFALAVKRSIKSIAAVDRAFARLSPLRQIRAVRRSADGVLARVGQEIGERSGAHDRVRAAGRSELALLWLGSASADAEPRPYLTQLFDIIDRTARDARETIA